MMIGGRAREGPDRADGAVPCRRALEKRPKLRIAPGRIRERARRVALERIEEVRSEGLAVEIAGRFLEDRGLGDHRAVVAAFALKSVPERVVSGVLEKTALRIVENQRENSPGAKDAGRFGDRSPLRGGRQMLEETQADHEGEGSAPKGQPVGPNPSRIDVRDPVAGRVASQP